MLPASSPAAASSIWNCTVAERVVGLPPVGHIEPRLPCADGGKLPLVLFLHGAGERGDDNAAQLKHGAVEFQRRQETYPCFVLLPQCPEGKRWVEVDRGGKAGAGAFPDEPSVPLALTFEVVDELIAAGNVDPDRQLGCDQERQSVR